MAWNTFTRNYGLVGRKAGKQIEGGFALLNGVAK